MENSSKALIIAGALLISILIIAVGMFVFNGANSSITDTMSAMSTQEIETFNAKYSIYEGEQTGSNVKSLIGVLISNSNSNKDENIKIPGVYFEEKGNSKFKNSGLPENGENSTYIEALQNIKLSIENKHKYWIEVSYQNNGLIDYINISYDKNKIIKPMSRN
ncbi:MAG: hypothetical protein IKL55_03730 [Clostridia bacterium]|nr:hypothetical protein [Clostridia bacterium]